jgi:hypothetical protein
MDAENSVISPLRINAAEVPGTVGLIGMAELTLPLSSSHLKVSDSALLG